MRGQQYTIEAAGMPPFEFVRIQGFISESPTSTYVHLQIARTFTTDRAVAAGMLQTTFQDMAARDAAVLETVQRQLADGCPLRRDLNVKADRAAVRARRSSRRC